MNINSIQEIKENYSFSVRIMRCANCIILLKSTPIYKCIITAIFQFVTKFTKKFHFFKFIYKKPLFFFLFSIIITSQCF